MEQLSPNEGLRGLEQQRFAGELPSLSPEGEAKKAKFEFVTDLVEAKGDNA